MRTAPNEPAHSSVSVRPLAKQVARAAALALVLPAIASFRLRSLLMGRDRALMGSSQALSLLPGVLGQYVRTAFLRRSLAHCSASVLVEFGTTFSRSGAWLGDNVYIGPMCHLGLVTLERDVLLAAAVHIPSGPDTHGIAEIDRPIREQPGTPRMVRIGAGSWIGSGAIVMADVGERSVIAAGSVVTQPIPPLVVAGGVPARVIKHRG